MVKDVALEVTLLRAPRALGIPGIDGAYVIEVGAPYHVVVSTKKTPPWLCETDISCLLERLSRGMQADHRRR